MHRTGVNPTLALQRDLELMEHLDRLGYAEAWIGEHHSAGSELIASPEVFIAAAAERTKHIKLGTGVNSLPYHHPFVLADRIVMLDHLTRGRMMFGAGPGQLTSDAMMLGIDPLQQRPRMEESLEVMMRLFAGETVTAATPEEVAKALRWLVPEVTDAHPGKLVLYLDEATVIGRPEALADLPKAGSLRVVHENTSFPLISMIRN